MTAECQTKIRLSCFKSKAFREFLMKADDALFEIEKKENTKEELTLNVSCVEIYDDKIRYKGKDYYPLPNIYSKP